jgi:hypothetical protein
MDWTPPPQQLAKVAVAVAALVVLLARQIPGSDILVGITVPAL